MSDDEKVPEQENEQAANGAKGGEMRAKVLHAKTRSVIAQRAAMKRWGKTEAEQDDGILRAICGSDERPLKIGDVEIPCYVLSDGRRVLVQRGLQVGVGMSTGGGTGGTQRLANLVTRISESGIDVGDLASRIQAPVKFVLPAGGTAFGYEAIILADICSAVIEASERGGILQDQQKHIARACSLLMRGFARVGLIALIDEATGYQDIRSRHALADILEAFIATELRKWVRTFPVAFYREMYRLQGWHFDPESVARPGVVGRYTNDLIYARLAPGILVELRKKTPRRANGRLKHHMHRWLTDDVGNRELQEHFKVVIALMRANTNWDKFIRQLDRALPKFGHNFEMAI